jgi:hypothetical protein
MWDDLWGVIWFFFWIFAFSVYLIALFSIVGDVLRDKGLSGWAKALWILFLVFVPFVTALIYLTARGTGMSDRYETVVTESVSTGAARHTAPGGYSASDEIAKAKALLDAGTISAADFESLKARAVS